MGIGLLWGQKLCKNEILSKGSNDVSGLRDIPTGPSKNGEVYCDQTNQSSRSFAEEMGAVCRVEIQTVIKQL